MKLSIVGRRRSEPREQIAFQPASQQSDAVNIAVGISRWTRLQPKQKIAPLEPNTTIVLLVRLVVRAELVRLLSLHLGWL